MSDITAEITREGPSITASVTRIGPTFSADATGGGDTPAAAAYKAAAILWSPTLTPEPGDTIYRVAYTPGNNPEIDGLPANWIVLETYTWGDLWADTGDVRVLVGILGTDYWASAYARATADGFVPIATTGLSLITVACGGSYGEDGGPSIWVGVNFDGLGGGSDETVASWFYVPHLVGAAEVRVPTDFSGNLSGAGYDLLTSLRRIDGLDISSTTPPTRQVGYAGTISEDRTTVDLANRENQSAPWRLSALPDSTLLDLTDGSVYTVVDGAIVGDPTRLLGVYVTVRTVSVSPPLSTDGIPVVVSDDQTVQVARSDIPVSGGGVTQEYVDERDAETLASAATYTDEQVAAEAERAGSAEGEIADDLAAETSRAQGVEGGLQAALDDEITRATGVEAVKADLVDGVLPTSQLPALAISDTFVVANQTAMLALDAQRGDLAVRTDNNHRFILTADTPSVLGAWVDLGASTDAVLSVNGQVGVIVLGYSDVGADASGAAASAQMAAATDATTKANAAQSTAISTAATNAAVASKSMDTMVEGTSTKILTAAERAKIALLSGTNTGDQDLSSLALKATQVIAGTGLTGGGTLAADRTLTVAYGTTSVTAARGDDARLSDTRTPTDASVGLAKFDATQTARLAGFDINTWIDRAASAELNSSSTNGTWATQSNTSAWRGFLVTNTSTTDGDWIEWTIPIAAGTYSVFAYHLGRASGPTVQVAAGGSNLGSSFGTSTGTSAVRTVLSTTFVLAVSARVAVRVTISGTTSATGVRFSGVQFQRTA